MRGISLYYSVLCGPNVALEVSVRSWPYELGGGWGGGGGGGGGHMPFIRYLPPLF